MWIDGTQARRSEGRGRKGQQPEGGFARHRGEGAGGRRRFHCRDHAHTKIARRVNLLAKAIILFRSPRNQPVSNARPEHRHQYIVAGP